MLGAWDTWWNGLCLDTPELIGDDTTYRLGAEYLSDCDTIADWGCGKGGLRLFVPLERYRGIDGSATPFASVIADLRTYRSNVCGIFMRHVLEHNDDWFDILVNAGASARHRLFIAIFTPPTDDDSHTIAFNLDPGVPDISFNPLDILLPLEYLGFSVSFTTIPTQTQYGVETYFCAERIL